MEIWRKIVVIAVLLCPLMATAGRHDWQAPHFVAGREYHTGHSARPHKVKKNRKPSTQSKQEKQDKQKPDQKPPQ